MMLRRGTLQHHEPEEVLQQPLRRGAVKEGSWEVVPEQSLEEQSSRSELDGKKGNACQSRRVDAKSQGQERRPIIYTLKPSWNPPGKVSPFSGGCPHKPIPNQRHPPNTHSSFPLSAQPKALNSTWGLLVSQVELGGGGGVSLK